MTAIIQNFIKTPAFYLWQIAISIFLLLFALFSQYVLELEPCELCVIQRLIFSAIILISLLALAFNSLFFKVFFTIIITAIYLLSFWLARYQIDIELGKIISVCRLDSIFPSWFALDVWLPQVYKVKGLCSDINWHFFGFTMAQILSYISVFLSVWGFFSFIYSFKRSPKYKSNNYKFDL